MDAGSEVGITLAQLAGVRAGLAAGFELEVVLRNESVTTEAWTLGEEAWEAELERDAEGAWTLDETYDALLAAARVRYARPVPPLDEDLGAWLDFVRIWGETEEPLTMLADLGLLASDLMYLHALWAQRFADLPPLQQAAMAHLSRVPSALPIPRPGAATPRPPAPDAVGGLRLPQTFRGRLDMPDELVPPSIQLRFEPLPESDEGPPSGLLEKSAGAGSTEPAQPSDVPLAEMPVDEAPLGFVEYAALVAQLEVTPERRDEILGAHGLHEPARLTAVEEYWRKRFADSELDRTDWERARQRLVKHFRQLHQR